jgi:hypothetical protein
MELSKITAIGRPLDPKYPPNLAIAVTTCVIILGGFIVHLLQTGAWDKSILWGIGSGLYVFLAWALCREIDPDHDLSAFVAVVFTLIALFIGGFYGQGILFWLLLAIRIVNRTTGLPATILDSTALLGLGSWVTFQTNWGYGALTIAAFALDSCLEPKHRRQIIFASLSAVITIIAVCQNEAGFELILTRESGGIIAAASVVFFLLILGSKNISSKADATNENLDPKRIQAGQMLTLLTGINAVLWNGASGIKLTAPLWAAGVGAVLYRMFLFLLRK